MPQQSPFANRAITLPFLRRKRTIFALATSLITLYLFLRFSLFSRNLPVRVDDIHGLLYMVSKTENFLPHNFDVNTPTTPSTWVPSEAYNQKLWKKRIEQLDKDTPIIVFSKTYCPYSRRAKELFARYALKPAPHIIEVDLRDDSDAIKSLLYRLTGRATFPNVILRGKSLGGYDNLQELHDTGELEARLRKADVTIAGNVHGE